MSSIDGIFSVFSYVFYMLPKIHRIKENRKVHMLCEKIRNEYHLVRTLNSRFWKSLDKVLDADYDFLIQRTKVLPRYLNHFAVISRMLSRNFFRLISISWRRLMQQDSFIQVYLKLKIFARFLELVDQLLGIADLVEG